MNYPEHVAIVGTGPSLTYAQLDELDAQDVFSISVNRIFLAFEHTEWRPQEVVLADKRRNDEFVEDCIFYMRARIPLVLSVPLLYAANNSGKLWEWWRYKELELPVACNHMSTNPPSAWHMPHLCVLGGSTFVAIQKAVRGGVKSIDLYGCDFHYDGLGADHFIEGYLPKEEYNQETLDEANDGMMLAWDLAKKECEARGVTIQRIGNV